MGHEEENFDKLFKNVLRGDFRAPSQANFTQKVMQNVTEWNYKRQKSRFWATQLIYALTGIVLFIGAILSLWFIVGWELLVQWSEQIGQFVVNALAIIPVTISPWVLLIGVVYFIVSRLLFSFILVKKQRRLI